MASILVQKFGGTSVEDPAALRRLAGIVSATVERSQEAGGPVGLVVVVSAMGKTTNRLVEIAAAAAAGDPAEARVELQALRAAHLAAAGEIAAPDREAGRDLLDEIDGFIAEGAAAIEGIAGAGSDLSRRAAATDALLAAGELLSSRITAAALRAAGLNAAWVDVRPLIRTSADFGRGMPDMEASEVLLRDGLSPILGERRLAVTQGFLGSTADGRTTTLGRGGSDWSAAIIGAALGAREIQIWTDVDGVLTTDPRIVPGARTIGTISMGEAAELAYFGAKVLHPSTLHPAMSRGIPVHVLNSRNPDGRGTTIVPKAVDDAAPVRAIAMKRGITVLKITSDRMLMAHGFLSRLFEIFSRHRTSIDMVTTSEVSVSMTLDDARSLDAILGDLRSLGEVIVDRDQAIVCLVGTRLRDSSRLVARVFGTLGDIPVSMISHGASAINISFVVPGSSAEEAVRRLHGEFFGGEVVPGSTAGALRGGSGTS